MAGPFVPRATEGEVGDSVCEAQRRRWYVSVLRFESVVYFVRVVLRNQRLFTQRVLPALLLF